MDETSSDWMAYIDAEVRAACEHKDWGSQLRRKWSVRDKPVPDSSVEDYEWKLIPHAEGRLPDRGPHEFDEGIYYVLSLDRGARRLVLQHDTAHCGEVGPHFWRASYTEIHLIGLGFDDAGYVGLLERLGDARSRERVPVPPRNGLLRDQLLELTSRFMPNQFSLT